MCGRFTISAKTDVLLAHFGLDVDSREVFESLTPRYNVAPTQTVPIVRAVTREDDGRGSGRPMLVPMRWGLIPGWAKDTRMGSRLINARVETVAEKPAFRSAFRRRRCLVPATGFFEWARGPGKRKQPHLIRRRGGEVFAFAGLWETWRGSEQPELIPAEPIVSFTIITGRPNELAGRIHDRMPVILSETAYEAWLDPGSSRERLESVMTPYPAEAMEAHSVETIVNNPRNDEPACLRPIDPGLGSEA